MKIMKDDTTYQTYLTNMNIYFKEDNLWVLVTQHVESWSYSDTGPAPEEAVQSNFECKRNHLSVFLYIWNDTGWLVFKHKIGNNIVHKR